MTSRVGGSASPAASCSRRLITPRSKRCRASPTNTASGACAGSASTYHVDIDAHYYSVPYRFARAEVDARLTARGVEIFHKDERIAVHLRASGNRKHTTVPEHMPSSHRRYAGWTIERIREDARKIGPATAALCKPHPEQGCRAGQQARSDARAKAPAETAPILHPNIRGPRYYH
jgi:transposase